MAKAKPYLGVYENMEFPDYQFREYPKMISIRHPETKKVEEKIVHNRAEELRAVDDIVQTKTYDAVVKEKEELQAKLALLEAQTSALAKTPAVADKGSLLDLPKAVEVKQEKK